jgi:hypothetical protein
MTLTLEINTSESWSQCGFTGIDLTILDLFGVKKRLQLLELESSGGAAGSRTRVQTGNP